MKTAPADDRRVIRELLVHGIAFILANSKLKAVA
jgi:hypothetical protein